MVGVDASRERERNRERERERARARERERERRNNLMHLCFSGIFALLWLPKQCVLTRDGEKHRETQRNRERHRETDGGRLISARVSRRFAAGD